MHPDAAMATMQTVAMLVDEGPSAPAALPVNAPLEPLTLVNEGDKEG